MNNLLHNINLLYDRKQELKQILINSKQQPLIDINDNVIMLHIMGEEVDQHMHASYICTTLRQIETANKLGIPNDRIFIIFGKVGKKENKCNHPAGTFKIPIYHKDQIIPKDVNLCEVSDINNFKNCLNNILIHKTTLNTPIIFSYDAHGYVGNCLINGNMIIYNTQIMDDKNIVEIFQKANRLNNNKIFIWTQCGSYDFVQRVKDKLHGFHIASTKKPNDKGIGSGVMREFTYKLFKLQYGTNKDYYIDSPNLPDLTFNTYNTKFYAVLTDKKVTDDTKILDYLHLKLVII